VKPATSPHSQPLGGRLLYVDTAAGAFSHHRASDLPSLLAAGDLVVVNDAATMPASLCVVGRDMEVRLVRRGKTDRDFTAVLFGSGDFRLPTEERPEPAKVYPGERLDLGGGLAADVTGVDAGEPRLVDLRFNAEGARLWVLLYQRAKPIQYAYLQNAVPLWEFQNRFAARPWALEMPSAGRALTWDLLFELRKRGIGLAHVTHAAGISSTGSAKLDSLLPLPERYEIGGAAVEAIAAARSAGGRVVAVGTTVVRALEASYAERGALVAGPGEARLVLGPGFRPKVVDGVLSGMHEPATSHFALLEAFAGRPLLERAFLAAERAGYLQHEFGDTTLVLPQRPRTAR
jgi:S-adenosylmethionine:tRNA ribosyltransferase-isomerase